MDERQLAELFRAAAEGGPPASFGHSDVVAASRRATTRRRVGTAGGAALGVAVLLGGVLVGSGFFQTEPQRETSTADGSGPVSLEPFSTSGRQENDQGRPDMAPPAESPLDTSLKAPASPSDGTAASAGKPIPWPGLAEDAVRNPCGPPDRELAVALANELPAAAGTEAEPVPDGCPPGARAVAVAVSAGEVHGWIYVVLGPVRGDGPPDKEVLRAEDGARGYQVYTPKGALIVVLSVPSVAGGPPPFADQTMRLAEKIGAAY